MYRLGYLVAFVLALFPLIAHADTPCPRWLKVLATRSAAVDEINRLGFREFQLSVVNDASFPWYPVQSPVTSWYLCLAIALGTPDAAKIVNQPGIKAFTDALVARNGKFVARAWLDRSRAQVAPDVDTWLKDALATKVISMGTTPISYSNRVFEPLQTWLAGTFPEMPDAKEFVSDLGRLSLGGDAKLALAFVYGLSGNARFDVPLDSWPNAISVPFFEDERVQGIRLDSTGGHVSLYLFRGTDEAVRRLKGSMDYAAWRSIRKMFTRRAVHFNPSSFTFDSRRSYATTDGYNAYGAKVHTPQDFYAAQEQTHVAFTKDGIAFAAVSGEEGVDNVPFELRDRFSYPHPRPLTTAAPMLFVLEDMDTQVVLLLGMNAEDRATTE